LFAKGSSRIAHLVQSNFDCFLGDDESNIKTYYTNLKDTFENEKINFLVKIRILDDGEIQFNLSQKKKEIQKQKKTAKLIDFLQKQLNQILYDLQMC